MTAAVEVSSFVSVAIGKCVAAMAVELASLPFTFVPAVSINLLKMELKPEEALRQDIEEETDRQQMVQRAKIWSQRHL